MTVRIGVGVAAPTGLCHGTASRTAWHHEAKSKPAEVGANAVLLYCRDALY